MLARKTAIGWMIPVRAGNDVRADAFRLRTRSGLPSRRHPILSTIARRRLVSLELEQERSPRPPTETPMLIPIADVPRWYAERKPKDTIAISHGSDAITWEQLERNANRRARAFAAKGVKPGDFVAIGLPNSNQFFETTFAVWKCGATPTSLTWRLPRGEAAAVLDILKPSLGGRRPARLECAEFAARRFRAGRLFRRAGQQSGGALLEGDDIRRLDRASESDPRSPACRDRYRRAGGARHAARRVPAQSRAALPQRPLHRFAHRAVPWRARHRPRQVRCRGMFAPDRMPAGCSGSISCPP